MKGIVMTENPGEDHVASLSHVIDRFYDLSTDMAGMRAREHDLTIAQLAVLHAIVELGPDVPMIEISRATKSPPSSITGIADRLHTLGHIDRVRPPEDRRTVHVSATESGDRIISTIVESQKQELGEVLANMPPNRVDQFIETFSEFVEIFDAHLKGKKEGDRSPDADEPIS